MTAGNRTRTIDPAAYVTLSGAEMGQRVASGAVSPVALAECAIALTEALEPKLNAFWDFDPAALLKDAALRDAEARAGRLRGPLHGVPMVVKDTFYTPGRATARGSRAYRDYIPTQTSPMLQRMLDAGAVMVGKTTMTEMGWTGASTSPLTGVTRNPWNPALTAGGSSSGTGAAVAARIAPVGLGGDGGGSVRIPGAFCGVVGYKQSHGRVPQWPGSIHDLLLHPSPMTATVRDAALVIDITKGPDPRDPNSLPATAERYADALGQRPATLRIAFAPTLFGAAVDPEIGSIIARAVADLRRESGWNIEERVLPWRDPADTFATLWAASRLHSCRALLPKFGNDLDPGLLEVVRKAQSMTLADYLSAYEARRAFNAEVHGFFTDCDLLLTPTMPVQAFAADAGGPPDMDQSLLVPWVSWSPFTYPFNLSGSPAASIPCGFTSSGMPVGLQVIGPRHHDGAVLNACHWIETFLQVHHRMPGLTRAAL